MNYLDFLATKSRKFTASGFDAVNINSQLFDFQQDIVRWALRKGKACVFLSTGLGKTAIQLEWAVQVCAETSGDVLILAPLAVASQTITEGKKFNIPVNYCRSDAGVKPGVNVTNYEMLGNFDCAQFSGVVLDESSILKSFTSKTRNQIITSFKDTPFRLACTATPAPNDHMELGNHAEFVGIVSRSEMLSLFFTHDQMETSKYRLKKHAENEFWQWVASWAVMLSKPSDVGYPTAGYDLPPLNIIEHTVDDKDSADKLLAIKAARRINRNVTLDEARELRKLSIDKRVSAASAIVNASDAQFVVWCDLNDESAALAALIPGSVEVVGSDTPEFKVSAFNDFTSGKTRVLITKPSIAGFGMNWQHCSNTVFVGLSYSFEAYYQAVRRFWRFGQTKEVTAHIITAAAEAGVVEVIKRKEQKFAEMLAGMISATQEITKDNIKQTIKDIGVYTEDKAGGDTWRMRLGDSCTVLKDLPDNSIGFSVFSPPFTSLYTYSNSERDLGNCTDDDQFFAHFQYIIKELLRVTKPGRLVSVHCMLLPTSKSRNGYIGIRDFRGDLIRAFQAEMFIFHSEVAIWKNPVVAMQRTKALGLLHKTIRKDSAMSRNGINDYLLTFRKPGENAEPISHTHETFPVGMWQQFASPVWADINPSNTLQYRSARDNNDERHICPLQLDVIQRAIYLWSNPGDWVLSPFAGIGSEGYQALEMGRRFFGIELKKSYFDMAVVNLTNKAKEVAVSGPDLACPVFNVFTGRESYGIKKAVGAGE